MKSNKANYIAAAIAGSILLLSFIFYPKENLQGNIRLRDNNLSTLETSRVIGETQEINERELVKATQEEGTELVKIMENEEILTATNNLDLRTLSSQVVNFDNKIGDDLLTSLDENNQFADYDCGTFLKNVSQNPRALEIIIQEYQKQLRGDVPGYATGVLPSIMEFCDEGRIEHEISGGNFACDSSFITLGSLNPVYTEEAKNEAREDLVNGQCFKDMDVEYADSCKDLANLVSGSAKRNGMILLEMEERSCNKCDYEFAQLGRVGPTSSYVDAIMSRINAGSCTGALAPNSTATCSEIFGLKEDFKASGFESLIELGKIEKELQTRNCYINVAT